MGDQLRVTLVATGLGTNEIHRHDEFTYQKQDAKAERDYRYGGARLVDRGANLTQRRGAFGQPSQQAKMATRRTREAVSDDLDYLDIPAFLRRQVDQVE